MKRATTRTDRRADLDAARENYRIGLGLLRQYEQWSDPAHVAAKVRAQRDAIARAEAAIAEIERQVREAPAKAASVALRLRSLAAEIRSLEHGDKIQRAVALAEKMRAVRADLLADFSPEQVREMMREVSE